MSPLTFEGISYENFSLNNTRFIASYLTGMKDKNDEAFLDLAGSSKISETNPKGKQVIRGHYNPNDFNIEGQYIGSHKSMLLIGAEYQNPNISAVFWSYNIEDFLSANYIMSSWSHFINPTSPLTLALELHKQDDIGDAIAGNINTYLYGLQISQVLNYSIKLFIGLAKVKYDEDSYDGGSLFAPWGSPVFFNSLQIQDGELAGTKFLSLGSFFDLGQLQLLKNSILRIRYGYFDTPDDLNDYDARQQRNEFAIDFRYTLSAPTNFDINATPDGFSLVIRIAYNDYESDYDYQAYENIHSGRSFEEVEDNYLDSRLYLQYAF